ncbi:uncharacterized protein LOC126901423 [Daktulosphaira vitifoliae]|uniref:uncharacterized protein LOC126901423 n=1 Tax=Daktulosphaira vitifoliae TaxID=58002 RepID=UPI0021A9C3E3|nr:uncharacterized protein LOC126901423 [Daktulosphaira vitifoliae]
MDTLDDVEVACVVYAMYLRRTKKHKINKKTTIRKHWVHPLNLKRPRECQFQVNFLTLRSYPEEFFRYYRMSIHSFDELILLVGSKLQKEDTCLRLSIPPEERLTVTLR